jgi:hypothetical protein
VTTDRRATFPRRDPEGRIARFDDLVVALTVALVVAFLVLAAFDVLSPLIGIGSAGTSQGWLSAVLAIWLYVEDFRAWRGVRSRLGIMLVALLVGVAVGAAAAYGADALGAPTLITGAVGAAVWALAYAPIWFYGMRWAE